MKKTVSILVVSMLVVVAGAMNGDARTAFGFKAGLVSADQSWEYSNSLGKVNRDHSTGLAVGVFARLPVAPVLEIRPGVMYVQKGSQIKITRMTEAGIPVSTDTYKDRINYLSLEAIAKVKTPVKTFPLYVFGGPRLDFKVGTSSDLDSSEIQSILDAYNSTVAGLRLGVGAERAFGARATFFVEICYDYDFGEAAKYTGDEATLTIDNRAFLVLVGMAF